MAPFPPPPVPDEPMPARDDERALLAAWVHRLHQACTEAEVILVAHEYVASVGEADLELLPPRCRPRTLFCANDVSSYAFDLVHHPCDEMDATSDVVRRLAAFFTHAAVRLTEIIVATNEQAGLSRRSA